MNQRERILALTALAVVILVGGGFLFKFLFLDALWSLGAQIDKANQDLQTKQAELTKEAQDEKTILLSDPRLLQWQKVSLPADKNEAQEIKNGQSPDDVKKHHDDLLQGEYERFLHDLATRSGFSQNTLKISSAPADRKGAPILTGKTPAYTRMSFTVQGQARLDAVQKMLEEFHRTPLLHQVRNLTLTVRQQPTRTPTAPAAPTFTPGAPPGGPPGFAAAPSGFPGGATGGDLDVSMTVEALLVTGAEKRDTLQPDSTGLQVQTLATGKRQYSDLLAKNMFTGKPAKSIVKEDPQQVLSAVRLTTIWYNGRRWQATYYDQNKSPYDQTDPAEKTLRLPAVDEFTIKDKYTNDVVKAKVVKLDEDGVVFLADGKYYRWRCGEFLGRRPNRPGAKPSADDENPYIPGVMDTPLTGDDLKELGLSKPATGSGN